jgi:lipoprotein signal peptidase
VSQAAAALAAEGGSRSLADAVSRLWFWVPVVPLLALDLWSKAAAFGFLDARYPGQSPTLRKHLVWDGPIRFDLVRWHNTGTIWGLLQGYNLPLVLIRSLAVLGILYYVCWHRPRPGRGLQVVLGAILAGALGNLYDNLTEPQGGVRDFLYFTFFDSYGFPAFNVADACISVGVISLIAATLLSGSGKPAGPRG